MQMRANEMTKIHIPLYTKALSEMRIYSNVIPLTALQEDDAYLNFPSGWNWNKTVKTWHLFQA